MSKIAIIGRGYVGQKLYEFFKSNNYETYSFDIDRSKSDVEKIEDLNEYNLDFAFICVPTQMNADGTCNTSLVEEAVKKIDSKTIVIESTIAPGTTKRLVTETGKDILFTPEYFGETSNHPLNDFNNRSFFVIGGEQPIRRRLIELFRDIFQAHVEFHQMDSTSAEIVKYMENSALATRVILCEEFYKICEAFGVDYYQVREGWLADPRNTRGHTFPGKGGEPGFGGKCFPKDVSAIIKASEIAGHEPKFLKAMFDYNSELRNEK